MKVKGTRNPGSFSVERIPGTNKSLVRLYQNVTPCQEEDFEGFSYDEYHVVVEHWDGVTTTVRNNYEEFLRQGMENEIDRSNAALANAQADSDAILIDLATRTTILELNS